MGLQVSIDWSRTDTTFEYAACGHQSSLTSGTVIEKTRNPLKMWYHAIFEISTRTGISGKNLQRITGFGSYETAWTEEGTEAWGNDCT